VEQPELEKLKTELHRTLISKLDLEKLSRVNSVQARQAVSEMINEIIVSQRVP
jgi:pilus assembly protein CpaF